MITKAVSLQLAILISLAGYSQKDTLKISNGKFDTVRFHSGIYSNPMLRSGAKGPNPISVDGYVLLLNTEGQKGKDIETLSHLLTDSFENDSEKVRAIFYWMTQNIGYDCKRFHENRSFSVHQKKNEKYSPERKMFINQFCKMIESHSHGKKNQCFL